MKKIVCFSLVLLAMLSCLSACNFTQSTSGGLAGDAECASKVEKMITALAENHIDDAKALMHPDAVEESDAAFTQMSTYLAGRETTSIEMININVKTSTGTSGTSRQEQVAYQVTLADGDIIYLNVVYLSDNDGIGFITFQLVLGVI